jgi:uncharacterized protein YlzI (FlbEa/FlbD family)
MDLSETFSVSLKNGEPNEIKVDGKTVNLDSLIGTKVWDKVNNVISLAYGAKYIGHESFNEVVDNSGYFKFTKRCLNSIYGRK